MPVGANLGSTGGLTTGTRVVILVAFYFVGGLVGKQASFLSGTVAQVWPPRASPWPRFCCSVTVLAGRGAGRRVVLIHERGAAGLLHLRDGHWEHMGRCLRVFVASVCGFHPAMERTRDVVGYIGWLYSGHHRQRGFNVVGLMYAGEVALNSCFPRLSSGGFPMRWRLVVAPASSSGPRRRRSNGTGDSWRKRAFAGRGWWRGVDLLPSCLFTGFRIIHWPTCRFRFWSGGRCVSARAAPPRGRCWCPCFPSAR
jgi:hypothetical protein